MTLTLAASSVVAGSAGTGSAITCSIFGDEVSAAGADSFKLLYQGVLGTSPATLYTVGGTVSHIIKTITLVNVTAGVVTVAMFVGGTAAGNRIATLSIPANGSATFHTEGWSVYDAAGQRQFVGNTGPTGARGALYRGAYNGGTSYSIDDVVFDNGSAWIAISAGSGTAPPTLPTTSNARWSLLSAKGDQGNTGNTGAAGLTWQGNWSGATTYALNDAVYYPTLGQSYRSLQAGNLNHTPPATADAWWQVLSLKGDTGTAGGAGPQGDKGWSPVFNVVSDGARRVLQLNDWTGGAGTKPGNIGDYVSASGFTAVIANAVDIRGPAGTGDVSSTLTLTAGNGLTGGGTLAANRTFDVAAHADGSIVVNPDSIQVGVLATDAQHGNRGGGGIHANVVAGGAAGFMTGADKTKLDGIAAGANVGPPTSRLINTTAPLTGGGDLSADRTIAISPATTTTAGSLSAGDKRMIDNLHYDVVADYGWLGNDSQDNGAGGGSWASFAQIMNGGGGWTAVPTGARVYFPAGTYRTSVELTINVDKRLTFQGVNRYASIIKTTSATAHIFHKSVAGWYDSFQDLGFQSSVTKTAGSAIHISAANNVGMNIYRVWMTGMFWGISAVGSQSANLSVWADLDISQVANGGRGILINGDTINLMIHNATINAGAATTSACCEIRQSGAVQVTACDWIMGTNVLLIDSSEASGAGPQACYFTNCFFDQPQASVILIKGTRTANRIKFTQCGIATGAAGGAAGFHGIEVAGTGAGGVGTQTALPAGISIVDCDIYHQAGNGTGAGIRINGVQDVNIQNSRITGFNGSGGCGIRATPSAGSVTSVRINGCIIGPNSNLTVTNATGIQLDAGNFSRISISDNGIYGWSVAGIADSATTTYTNQKNIADNDGAGLISGTIVARTTTISVANTETEVIGFTAQGNVSLKTGMVLRFQASGIQSNTTTTSTSIWRIRIGPTTLTGAVVASWSVAMGATARTNVPFYVFGQVTILSATTAIGTITILDNSTTRYALPTTTITAAVTIATGPADQRVQLTVISGAASTTWNVFAAEVQAVVA